MMNFKKWIYIIALVLVFVVQSTGQMSIVNQAESIKVPCAKDIYGLSALKNLPEVTPTGIYHTYLGKKVFTNAYKFKPVNVSLITMIDDIKENGDRNGDKTERVVDIIMKSYCYLKLDGKYGGNKGYDGLYIKGTISKPNEIVIIECKQFRYHHGVVDSVFEHGEVTLNKPVVSNELPAQMSKAWVLNVADKLKKKEIKDMIVDNPKLIIKYVSAVDTIKGEINFLKLDPIY
jgi:hypothetical protein